MMNHEYFYYRVKPRIETPQEREERKERQGEKPVSLIGTAVAALTPALLLAAILVVASAVIPKF